MKIRRWLFDEIQRIVQRDQLGDTALAHVINTSRTRASSLRSGELHRFNSETLIDILARLGVTVTITIASERPYARWHIANPRPGWKPRRDMVNG
jgi:predicted XRE-type DNA-binding protein